MKYFLLVSVIFVGCLYYLASFAQSNRPPGTPTIFGPAQWFSASAATFSAVAYDPDSATSSPAISSQIRYLWDWEGDGITNDVSNFMASGQESKLPHVFPKVGNFTIKVMAEDSLGATSTWASFVVNIVTANQSPVLEPIGDKTASEGEESSFLVFASDGNSDTIVYSSSALPKGATFSKAALDKGYIFKWKPGFEQSGIYQMTFSVEDGKGGFDSEAITISVKNIITEKEKDVVSPTVTNFLALPTANAATIKWSIDEEAVVKIEYGVNIDTFGNSTAFTSKFLRTGETVISGLKPGTLYLYRIRVKDPAGNESVTAAQTFVATSLGVVEAGERKGKIESGTPIRIKGKPEVYQVLQGKLRHIPSPQSFSALSLKWNQVIEVENSEANYPRFKLARAVGDPRVYYITQGNLKKWIRDMDIFNSYDNRWEDVAVVGQKDLDIYPDVDLIKLAGDNKVYKAEGNTKRWIKNEEIFNKLKYDWSKVHSVNKTEFEFYKEGVIIE